MRQALLTIEDKSVDDKPCLLTFWDDGTYTNNTIPEMLSSWEIREDRKLYFRHYHHDFANKMYDYMQWFGSDSPAEKLIAIMIERELLK